jgi:hypothetical protein
MNYIKNIDLDIIIGILLSILYIYLILPRKEGGIPLIKFTLYPIIYKGMIHIPINKEKILHIHHWIICALCLILFYNKLNKIIIIFLITLLIQGLLYKDSFIILKKNNYNL